MNMSENLCRLEFVRGKKVMVDGVVKMTLRVVPPIVKLDEVKNKG